MSRVAKSAPVPELTEEEFEALMEFAVEHGEEWKSELGVAWLRHSAPAVLHRLRNTHGPAWLKSVELPRMPTAKMVAKARELLLRHGFTDVEIESETGMGLRRSPTSPAVASVVVKVAGGALSVRGARVAVDMLAKLGKEGA